MKATVFYNIALIIWAWSLVFVVNGLIKKEREDRALIVQISANEKMMSDILTMERKK